MTGQELYERYVQAEIDENLRQPYDWDQLTENDHKVWDNLAEQIRVHVQDSIGKVFE